MIAGSRRLLVTAAVAAAALAPYAGASLDTHAQSAFRVGMPTVVDPIRGVGEPDMVVDNSDNALITGPGGSGTQTSFFWRTRDGGLSYSLLGPSQGHWVCPASGGGDSLAVYDRRTGDAYLTDQEALADIGSAKIDGRTGAVTSKCASAPGMTADRPFEDILDSTTAPQTVADGGKPILYLSWLCSGCAGVADRSPTEGGLAFGWSDDGINFHAADPGVVADTPVTTTAQEGGTFGSFSEHGNTVVDPRTGYVYTGVSCTPSNGCPNAQSLQDQVQSNIGTPVAVNEVGIAVGKPQDNPSPANVGQFSSLWYQTAVKNDIDGAPMRQPNSLFPVLGIDSNGTLYEAYIEGDGFANTTDPLPSTAWHLYYVYSRDVPDHKVWSKPIQVDSGSQTLTTDFGWMAVGDPGKLGFVWLGTNRREHPSFQDTSNLRQWHPFMAETTNGLDAHPVFQSQEVGIGPNHINDMCLQGTVGCIQNVGNRNMADFISCDIGPDGALQAVWANDSNELATLPTTLIPGLPLTETARQVSGPRLRGSGDVSDSRFSAAPSFGGTADATGDGLYPVYGASQHNVPQLDLTGSQVSQDPAGNLLVHVSAADLTSTVSPDSSQQNVWYLTTWQFHHTIYFARAESDQGGALTFAAGPAKSFDRPGLNAQTVATLVDYSGGTAVQGTRDGNDITITVPAGLVGSPGKGDLLEAVSSYSALDNGQPLFVAPLTGNIPSITDATPAYNTVLGMRAAGEGAGANGAGGSPANAAAPEAAATVGVPNTSAPGGPLGAVVAGAGVAVAAAVTGRRRRRGSRSTPR